MKLRRWFGIRTVSKRLPLQMALIFGFPKSNYHLCFINFLFVSRLLKKIVWDGADESNPEI